MIDKKIILYILLGVCVFALWEAWQKDYGLTTTPNNISNAQSVSTATTVANKQVVAEPSINQKTATIAIPETRLIKVHTDVLEVAIDTEGGDIVQVDLPKYPAVNYQAKPTRLLSDSSDRYYIAQSRLTSLLGPDTTEKPAQYATSDKEYRLESAADTLKVKLLWSNALGMAITKTFTFTKNKYDIAVDYEIDNKSSKPWAGQFYAELKRKKFDETKGLFKISTYTGAAISSTETPYEKVSFSDIENAVKNNKEFIRENQGGWVAMQQRYFLSAWVPAQDKTYRYFNRVSNDGVYTVGLGDNTITVAPGDKSTISSVLYVGPEISENFSHLAKGLDRTVDYGWLWVIAVGFFWILKNIFKVVGNWGVAIILVTLLIKLAFYKLSESSCRSMAKMRELMPKIQAIKERYGDDKQKLHQATMDLYKKEKINPLNLGGCLPMLIQIPFFIALYYVLIGAVELRHAPFVFWLQDLSAADPYYILPILMGISMLLQQRLSPTSADPTQAKMMMFMPVVFTVFFINFPSGLVLYWLVNNLLSVLQQWYINKKLAK